jgi:AraC-like DNA-binding protein
VSEYAAYFRPQGLDGVEALHARFVRHAYRPHSHPTWTVAVVERGAARFTLDATDQRAVPEGWQYKVLYIEPELLPAWDERDEPGPRAARWTVFRDPRLRAALLDAHRALAAEPPGLAVDEAVLRAVAGLEPHLRPGPPRGRGGRAEHAAVRRAVAHLRERWNERVTLAELAAVAELSRFELARRFRAQMGLAPHAFQTNLRVARARGLLAGGTAPAAVAAACGFADQAHLTRTFRVAVGVTPARYASAVRR